MASLKIGLFVFILLPLATGCSSHDPEESAQRDNHRVLTA